MKPSNKITPQTRITIFAEMANLYKKEVDRQENPFSNEQKEELHQLLKRINSLSDDPLKYRGILKRYEGLERQFVEKFEAFGGDCDHVNASVHDFEKNKLPLILRALQG